jgi:hypothetical protein
MSSIHQRVERSSFVEPGRVAARLSGAVDAKLGAFSLAF